MSAVLHPALLEARILNRESVRWAGREVQPLRTRKAWALLLFLIAEQAYNGLRVHRREYLSDLFWPERDRRSGLENLRQTIYQLRRRLHQLQAEHEVLEVDRIRIALSPPLPPAHAPEQRAIRDGLDWRGRTGAE